MEKIVKFIPYQKSLAGSSSNSALQNHNSRPKCEALADALTTLQNTTSSTPSLQEMQDTISGAAYRGKAGSVRCEHQYSYYANLGCMGDQHQQTCLSTNQRRKNTPIACWTFSRASPRIYSKRLPTRHNPTIHDLSHPITAHEANPKRATCPDESGSTATTEALYFSAFIFNKMCSFFSRCNLFTNVFVQSILSSIP